MDVLAFLAAINPYGIMNWVAAAYALHVAIKTRSVIVMPILVVINVLFGIIAVMSSGV